MENLPNDSSKIEGWGMDADPRNEPTYPMKKYTGDDHQRLNWERPTQQTGKIEILHSNERPGLPAVFGTSVPPQGISGAIRRYAFRYSESSFAHWLPLLLADRINVIEGIVEDIKSGFFPNILAEKGWGAEWKHNKKSIAKRVLVAAAFITILVMYKKTKRVVKRK